MGLFSFLGAGKIKEVLKKGAVVVDVRSPHEYDNGRVPNSLNIPIERIAANIERLKEMNVPIVFCCSTDNRSQKAKAIMKASGLKDVYDAGSWQRVVKILKTI